VVPLSPTIPSPDQPVPDDFEPLCEHCGYTLTGLTTQTRCPECGEAFDVHSLPLARVPWLYRKRLGNNSAYWKTVWLILRHPRAFADELCRPVRISADDAKKFRRKSARLAACSISLCAIAILFYIATITHLTLSRWIGTMIGVGIETAVLYAFFIFATDLPTFIWSGLKGDPNNLAPLHHYAAAPLALSPLMGIGLLSVFSGAVLRAQAISSINPIYAHALRGTAVSIAGIAILTAVLFLIWCWPQIFMERATKCSTWRVLALALYLPVHWILIGFIAIAAGIMFAATISEIVR
jgi:hypothetical protein